METIKKFQVDIKGLSDKEKLVLEKLIKASELLVPLYERQKNSAYPGANFYPVGVSKEEIEKAAQKNPLLLHPYTFVEKDKRGRLKAVPFCLKFKRELREIAKLIGEAAKISEDKEFSRYLVESARALLKNDYAKNEILWVTKGPFKFNFIIGPIERYLDRLFFKKCAYQAWVGVLDRRKTEEAERFKKIILASRRKILPDTIKIELPKMRTEINQTLCFSGLIADNMFTGTNLPNDVNLMKEYGSKLIIFATSLELRFKQDQLPIFNSVFTQKIKESYSPKELYDGSLRCILLHEIAHSLIRYEDAEERLRELFPVFDEILAYVLGVRACGSLLLKGVITQKELEAILVMHICRHFNWWLDFIKNPDVQDYAIGAAIAQNFFLREGAIREKEGILSLDFTKLFISIDHLSRILEYHLASVTYEEAKKFVDEYGSFDVFEPFASRLKGFKVFEQNS